MKTENVTGDNFGFGRGKGNMDAIGMLKIASKRTLDIDEKLCAFFINWQKKFNRVNWSKLMQILKEMGIVWREKKLISKIYMDQGVTCDWTKWRQEVCR